MPVVVSVTSIENIDYFEIVGIYVDDHEADLAKIKWFINSEDDIDNSGFVFNTRVMTIVQVAHLLKLCGQDINGLVIQAIDPKDNHPRMQEIIELCTQQDPLYELDEEGFVKCQLVF